MAAVSRALADCPAGEEEVQGSCLPCALGFYKESEGADACERCPGNYTTLLRGATSVAGCVECPGTSILDNASLRCLCDVSINVRVPSDPSRPLQWCWPLNACNVSYDLTQLGILGEADHMLHHGSCPDNDDLLVSSNSCVLECLGERQALHISNYLRPVDTSVYCDSGNLSVRPLSGTWCGTAPESLPISILLACATVTSLIAGSMLHGRLNRLPTDRASKRPSAPHRPSTWQRTTVRTTTLSHAY